MGVKNSGYSIVNFLMDLVMVMSIVVFLNVSLRLVPENSSLSKVLPFKSPVSSAYEKMYTSDSSRQNMVMSSSSSTNAIHVHIEGYEEEEKKLPASSAPLFIRKAVYEAAMAKHLLSEVTTVDTISVPDVIRNTAIIRTYMNGHESAYVKPSGFVHNDAYPYDIALTTIVPISRIGNILKLTTWSGPINVCVYASKSNNDHTKIKEFINSPELKGKVTLVVVYSDFYDIVYPINILKNIAISTVFTTHFIMIDDSMIPSDLLYDKLRKAPVSVLYEPINLITIPVFYGEDEMLSRKDIKTCLSQKKCVPKYISMNSEWYDTDHQSYYMKLLNCIDTTQVYYFMRRHNSYDLLYDEQILTRGYDDVSLIQNLVNDGYIFHLLLDGYFIDTSLNNEIENQALQRVPLIREQFDLYLKTVVPQKGVQIQECTGKEGMAAPIKNYAHFMEIDQQIKNEEIKQLKNEFDSISSKLYDVLAWNRKVLNAATNREKRMKDF